MVGERAGPILIAFLFDGGILVVTALTNFEEMRGCLEGVQSEIMYVQGKPN
jgi:hypothetical protein